MVDNPQLEAGRRAFAEQRWNDAREHLAAADDETPLTTADLDRLAVATYLSGFEADSVVPWRRAHHELIDAGDPAGAARRAFWISLTLLLRGDGAQGAGWLARARRQLEGEPPCAEHGYVSAVEGLMAMVGGDAEKASVTFEEAVTLGERFGEPDLLAMALLGLGQARIQRGLTAEGVQALDESMVSVTSGEVSPILAGIVYCAVILTCQRIYDLRRSSEWTVALDRWCARQSQLVAFRDACLVHRSQLFQLRGAWSEALEEARRARDWSTERDRPPGRALYQLAELHRVRGSLDEADEMYRAASRAGTEPQPGISLLRLAEGEVDAAAASIRRVVDEEHDRHGPSGGRGRATVLAAYVEIVLAVGDVPAAREGADALAEIADGSSMPYLTATAGHAIGAVLLAEGDAQAALAALRTAWEQWRDLGAPYESARTRVLIGRACRALGDTETARSHVDAAAGAFEEMGASHDLERLRSEVESAAAEGGEETADGPLSAREREVLRLVAAGKTNRQIGAELFISEHTVARHLSNIYRKLGVSSRTAAAAYAFSKDLA